MKVQYAEMRNRQLKIMNEKIYDVSLVEKGDVLKITNGSRVLVDLIIIQGTLKAVQSARTGNDNIISLAKGDRLESGALIY
jgi:cation transport ATPase